MNGISSLFNERPKKNPKVLLPHEETVRRQSFTNQEAGPQ